MLASQGPDLYVSDAGLDTSSDYNSQETKNIGLLFGQFLTALSMLRPGSCLILKTYTFTKKLSITAIAAVSKLFQSFKIVKPSSSKILNSEVYLIGQNMKNDKNLLDKIIKTFEGLLPLLVKAKIKSEQKDLRLKTKNIM